MPIYEYVCVECGEAFSRLILSLDRPPTITCPACGSTRARKLVSLFAAHGLDCQVDSYTGGDDSDLVEPRPPTLGRKEIAEAARRGAS